MYAAMHMACGMGQLQPPSKLQKPRILIHRDLAQALIRTLTLTLIKGRKEGKEGAGETESRVG